MSVRLTEHADARVRGAEVDADTWLFGCCGHDELLGGGMRKFSSCEAWLSIFFAFVRLLLES
jgi:hypothetical protein